MNKSIVTVDALQRIFQQKGYNFFTNGDLNLNLIGIRAYPGVQNTFDDLVGAVYKRNGNWQIDMYAATTDPGTFYLNNPLNVKGTAALVEGQHKGAFILGMHQGKYGALVQNKPLPLYRDSDGDSVLEFDPSTISIEMAGINIHHASFTGTSVQVDKWSAGCQVIASISDFNKFYALCVESSKTYGSVFTYTLLNERDFS
jgi:hypothetical protein